MATVYGYPFRFFLVLNRFIYKITQAKSMKVAIPENTFGDRYHRCLSMLRKHTYFFLYEYVFLYLLSNNCVVCNPFFTYLMCSFSYPSDITIAVYFYFVFHLTFWFVLFREYLMSLLQTKFYFFFNSCVYDELMYTCYIWRPSTLLFLKVDQSYSFIF